MLFISLVSCCQIRVRILIWIQPIKKKCGSGPRQTKYGSGFATLTCTWKEKVGAWLAPSAWTTRYVGVIPRDWNLSYNKHLISFKDKTIHDIITMS